MFDPFSMGGRWVYLLGALCFSAYFSIKLVFGSSRWWVSWSLILVPQSSIVFAVGAIDDWDSCSMILLPISAAIISGGPSLFLWWGYRRLGLLFLWYSPSPFFCLMCSRWWELMFLWYCFHGLFSMVVWFCQFINPEWFIFMNCCGFAIDDWDSLSFDIAVIRGISSLCCCSSFILKLWII